MRERKTERLAYHLRCGGCPEKLASAAGCGAGATEVLGRIFERNLIVGEARAYRLHAPRVFPFLGQQRHTTGNEHAWQVMHSGQRHHHRGQPFIASRDAEDAAPRGQRPDQAPEHAGGVVAIWQAVEHPRSALCASIAWVGARSGEWDGAVSLQLM